MKICNAVISAILPIVAIGFIVGCEKPTPVAQSGTGQGLTLVQHGKMREVIGKQKHHGRILLQNAVQRPHLYAVGALEGLAGELTVFDGIVHATQSPTVETIAPIASPKDRKAALLVGFHVRQWSDHEIETDLKPSELEKFCQKQSQAGRHRRLEAFSVCR